MSERAAHTLCLAAEGSPGVLPRRCAAARLMSGVGQGAGRGGAVRGASDAQGGDLFIGIKADDCSVNKAGSYTWDRRFTLTVGAGRTGSRGGRPNSPPSFPHPSLPAAPLCNLTLFTSPSPLSLHDYSRGLCLLYTPADSPGARPNTNNTLYNITFAQMNSY